MVAPLNYTNNALDVAQLNEIVYQLNKMTIYWWHRSEMRKMQVRCANWIDLSVNLNIVFSGLGTAYVVVVVIFFEKLIFALCFRRYTCIVWCYIVET